MWSKGAVVIVKHGDREMANAMEQGLMVASLPPAPDYKVCKQELMAMGRSKDIEKRILEAEAMYGVNPEPCIAEKILLGVYGYVVYGISKFYNKYMRVPQG